MRVVDIFEGMARCVLVDMHGRIRNHFAYLRELTPLWLSIGPRSLWPEVTDLPDEEDEARASAPLPHRRKAKKPRRSKKLKRKTIIVQTITATLFDELMAA